jgi:hypothetical protein
MPEFVKELVKIGYDPYYANLETKNTFHHSNKEFKSPLMVAIRLSWDWCQGFKLNDGSIWAIAKVKTVPVKLLKSLEETQKYCEEFSVKYNHDKANQKHFLKEMTEAYFTKEKPYNLYVFGCDDSSYSQAFATLSEIEKLIASWSKNPPDAPWDGAIFTN